MPAPRPTPIYRLLHIDNLAVILDCGGMHAPNHALAGVCDYRPIHNVDIQKIRRQRSISCGPGGTVHDYVAFYLGPRSPMLLQLHTARVEDYDEGQEPLIYAVSTVETIAQAGLDFVFSDGHGIAAFTQWFDDLNDLDKVIGIWFMPIFGQTLWMIWIANGESRPNFWFTDSALGMWSTGLVC